MRNRIVLVWLIGLLLMPSFAWACRCSKLSFKAAFQQADSIVVAEVVQLSGDINAEGVKARLKVSQSWKQPVETELWVTTRTTCAFEFKLGESYLLYLNSTASGYSTNHCSGNLPLKQAEKTLFWLNNKSKSAGGR